MDKVLASAQHHNCHLTSTKSLIKPLEFFNSKSTQWISISKAKALRAITIPWPLHLVKGSARTLSSRIKSRLRVLSCNLSGTVMLSWGMLILRSQWISWNWNRTKNLIVPSTFLNWWEWMVKSWEANQFKLTNSLKINDSQETLGCSLFNQWTNYNKLIIHHILMNKFFDFKRGGIQTISIPLLNH